MKCSGIPLILPSSRCIILWTLTIRRRRSHTDGMPRGAAGLAAEVERRFRRFQRGTVRPIPWETVRSKARLYAERRAGTPLDWLWRITRARYDAMVAKGVLEEDEPIELLDGLLIVREPGGGRHAGIVGPGRPGPGAGFRPRGFWR